MNKEIRKICSDLNDGRIAVSQATEALLEIVVNPSASRWISVDIEPIKYGKHLVRRKDGKIHWETWNGSGWAYNGNNITHWSEIIPPKEENECGKCELLGDLSPCDECHYKGIGK